MSDDSSQTELPTDTQSSELRNRHQKILDLYNSGSVGKVAIGLWGKIAIEFAIVAVPLAILIIAPGAVLTHFDVWSYSYAFVITGWLTITATVFGITWCFLESDVFEEDGPDLEESSVEAQE